MKKARTYRSLAILRTCKIRPHIVQRSSDGRGNYCPHIGVLDGQGLIRPRFRGEFIAVAISVRSGRKAILVRVKDHNYLGCVVFLSLRCSQIFNCLILLYYPKKIPGPFLNVVIFRNSWCLICSAAAIVHYIINNCRILHMFIIR